MEAQANSFPQVTVGDYGRRPQRCAPQQRATLHQVSSPSRSSRARMPAVYTRTFAERVMITRRSVVLGGPLTISGGWCRVCAAASVIEPAGCVVAADFQDQFFAGTPADRLNSAYFDRISFGSGNKAFDYALAKLCHALPMRFVSCLASCFMTTATALIPLLRPVSASQALMGQYCSEPDS